MTLVLLSYPACPRGHCSLSLPPLLKIINNHNFKISMFKRFLPNGANGCFKINFKRIYASEQKTHFHINTCTWMFIAA